MLQRIVKLHVCLLGWLSLVGSEQGIPVEPLSVVDDIPNLTIHLYDAATLIHHVVEVADAGVV